MTDAHIKITALDQTQSAFASVSRNFDSLQGKLGGLGLALPVLSVGASAGALAALTLEASKAIDEFNDLKDATGASIENISALDRVARETGSDFNTVATSLIKFNKILNDSGTDGSRASVILKSLGLDAAKLKKEDPAEAMRQLAVAFATFADDGAKGRAILELTGKSAKEMAQFLKELSEKTELNGKTSTAAADEVEKFNKELSTLKANGQDAARAISINIITALNEVIAKFREGKKEGKGFFEIAWGRYKDNVKGFYGMAPDNTGGATGSWGAAEEKPSLKEDDPKKTGAGGSKKDPLAEAKRYLENLQKQREKKQELTTVEQTLIDLQEKRIGKVTPALEKEILATARQIDAEKELAELLKFKRDAAISFGDAINKSNEEYQSLLGRLLDATPSANLEKQRKDVKLLTDEFEAGRLSETLYLEAVTARLDLVADKTGQAKTAAEEYGMTMASAFEDAIISGKNFGDVLDGLIEDLARMALRKSVTEPMGNALSQAFSSSGGGDGLASLFSSFFSFDGGGSTGTGSRSGGLDGKGGFMAMLHPQETVIDHTVGQQSSGSSVVVNVIESPGNGGQQSRRTENGVDIVDIMVEKVKASMASDITRGSGTVPAALARTYGLNRTAGAY